MLDYQFDTPYQEFIFYRTYSRWNDNLKRRETWPEAVQRYMDFMKSKLGDKLKEEEYTEIQEAITKMEVVPSMRLLWAAGPAAERTNATAYNCTYTTPTKWQDFGEILYLLTCGTGVGFSVEKHIVDQLPEIKESLYQRKQTVVVEDSKEGWADALVTGLTTWASGGDIEFDYSLIRPEGARLVTMGGRASGPEPLKGLLKFTHETILSRQGKKLRPIDVHDIICKIGDIVVSGGVRRSSEISLSDLHDEDMRGAKQGKFYEKEPQRTMANNSAVYTSKPSVEDLLTEWVALVKSGAGERGIFNRGSLKNQLPARREMYPDMGTNPCGEIVLRPKQFCNLTEVVARKEDSGTDLMEKIRLATTIGTFQSSLTDFNYLSDEWKKNCEEERLLGVSITGQFDCEVAREETTLQVLKEYAIKINKEYSERMGIGQSKAITCVKPSGTVSQLVDASSGMHPRFSDYYIRRVRISATDPLFKMLKDQGIKYNPEVGQEEQTATTFVLEFPIKSPDGAITNGHTSALDQLSHWKKIKLNYTEHNPSNTIFVKEEEWIGVVNWIYNNWDIIGGLSFLPKDENVYKMAPYEKITEEEYNKLASESPKIDFSKLSEYEMEDNTIGAKEIACGGKSTCEIV